MIDPYLYRLIINGAYFILNVFSCAALIYAWKSTRMRDVVVGLMAGAIFLSIFTSASNLLVSIFRFLDIGTANENVIKAAFKVVLFLEPISMIIFYVALFVLSFRVLRTTKHSDHG